MSVVSKAVIITTSMPGSTYFSRSSTSMPDMPAIANVQHRDVNLVLLGQFDRGGAVAGHEDVVIVLENDPERLARPVFVIHNQQRAFAPGLRRRLRQRRHCV